MATESPELNSFLRVARSGNGDALLALTPDRQGVVTCSGRFARWISHFKRGENRELSRRFVDALCKEYGAILTQQVTGSRGLAGTLRRGKPLSARQVTRADVFARALKHDNHEHNVRLARGVTDSGQGTRASLLKTAISEAAQRAYPNDRTVNWIVDYKKVAAAVRDAIVVEAAGEGARRLTGMEAKEVLAEVVKREVAAAYRAREVLAMEALDPRSPGTIAHRVLVEKLAQLDPSPNPEKYGLTLDAADVCYKRLETAVGTAQITADEFDNELALQDLANEKLSQFMNERADACARLDELDFLDPQERSALRARVARDDIPAALVEPLGRAYRELKDDLHALEGPLLPHELQNSLSRSRAAISRALEASRTEVTVENQDRMHRSIWRLLLAPGGEAQASAILQQLERRESLLRGVGEAVTWYRENFPATEEWDRTFKNAGKDLNGKPIYENATRKTAVEYAVLMGTLQQVLAENAGASPESAHALDANACPDDQTVATVRNLGIPFPAPDRLGLQNNNVPLSNGARAEMQAALDRHVETAGRKRHASGLVNECVSFLRASDDAPAEKRERVRARFIVDGEQVEESPDAVAARLQEFCTDGNRDFNEAMLTGISLVTNQAPFRCVYAGCMNPDRPDLATMNGYPKGVFLGHTYRLWKNAANDVRLQVWEHIKPLSFHPVDQNTVLPGARDGRNGAENIEDGVLLSDNSDFQSLIEIGFDPQTWRPELKDVRISYALVPGTPSTRWFIKHPDLVSRSEGAEAPAPDLEAPNR